MKTPKNLPPVRANRIERILAIAVAVITILVIACFIALIIAMPLGVGNNDGLNHGVWPLVTSIAYYGLPVAFALIIALLVSNGVRRSRAAKRGES